MDLATPKTAKGLTAREVATLKTPGMHADGSGLYLQLVRTGARTRIYLFQFAGRRRDMGLGSVADFTLAEARERAAEAQACQGRR